MKRIRIGAICLSGLVIPLCGWSSVAMFQTSSAGQELQEGEVESVETNNSASEETVGDSETAPPPAEFELVEPRSSDPENEDSNDGDPEPSDHEEALSKPEDDSEPVASLPLLVASEGASDEAQHWVTRAEDLDIAIILGQAERTEADGLLSALEPQLKSARDQLRHSLAEGASPDTLKQQHAEMETLYDVWILLLQEATSLTRVTLTGFGAEGVQAFDHEMDRLRLHMRYQGRLLPDHARLMWERFRTSPIPFLKGVLLFVFVVVIFRLWRKWATRALPEMRQRMISARPRTRKNLRIAKFFWYLDRLRGPLEWLALIAVIASILVPAFQLFDEKPVF